MGAKGSAVGAEKVFGKEAFVQVVPPSDVPKTLPETNGPIPFGVGNAAEPELPVK
jgi:hypothetical protein